MKTHHCDECAHFNDEDVPGARVCEMNHKPRWYVQKNDNPHDTDYGYKRKCEDYTEVKNAYQRKAQALGKTSTSADSVRA